MGYKYIKEYDLGRINPDKRMLKLKFDYIFINYKGLQKKLEQMVQLTKNAMGLRRNKFIEIKAEIGKSTNPTGFIKTAIIVYSFESKRWQLKTSYKKFDETGIKHLEIIDRTYYVGEDLYNMVECMKAQKFLESFKKRIYQAEIKESFR